MADDASRVNEKTVRGGARPGSAGDIYALVCEVPKGEVASYGMVASLLPGVGPRQVGAALSNMPDARRAPWHRIVQASGAIAERDGAARQRMLLKREGVAFRRNGSIDWNLHRWRGPSQRWIEQSAWDQDDVMEIIAGWR